jgi:tetratricopeptide (TPR) repeat protein
MRSYERIFDESAELASLCLIGLFDRSAKRQLIDVLRQPPVVEGLNECLVGQSERQWQRTVARLKHSKLRERIRRRDAHYSVYVLGATGADLAALASLFDPPFDKPVTTLTDADQAFILNDAAFLLSALGRLSEAVAPMREGLQRRIGQESWRNASISAANLSELHLVLGDVAGAVAMGEASVAAHELFEEAEAFQAENEPDYPRLYSIQSYRYCDLLLALNRPSEVQERASYSIEIDRKAGWLLDIALDHVCLGRAALALGEHSEAWKQLDQAVDGLRKAGRIDHLPRGLLARAALFRESGDVAVAGRDLDEAMRITKRSEMQLFQCDAHLEYARLALVEDDREKAREQVAAARRLVDETGYGRRRPEVERLEAQVP